MKILVHGRKDGYKVLYPKPTPPEFYSFASDIQSISANNYDVYYGKTFYTLAFVDAGCIFTKYIIGEDVERGQLGEIGISVFIPYNQKLSGVEIKTLLDDLIKAYSKYLPGGKIGKPQENSEWQLFDSIAKGFNPLPCSSNNDIVKAGMQAPAFHYYKSDSELIAHFDKPFQEEYNDYRQILFIDSHLQGDANPLSALQNSGVEVNPDLEDEPYYLKKYIQSKQVKISVFYNNEWIQRSDVRPNNSIRAKQWVKILYAKDDRCFERIEAEGTISDINSDIHKYLVINNDQIMLNYEAFNNPPERQQNVTFKIINIDKNKKCAEIKIDADNWEQVNGSEITKPYYGLDIVGNHHVLARQGENFYSDNIPFCPIDKKTVEINLHEFKRVKITATIDNEDVPVFEFQMSPKNYTEKEDHIFEFIDTHINDTYEITVSAFKNEFHYSGHTKFCPRADIPIKIDLFKKRYYLEIDEKKGKRTCKGQPIIDSVFKYPDFECDPHLGYMFLKWERKEVKYTAYDGYFEAIFIETKTVNVDLPQNAYSVDSDKKKRYSLKIDEKKGKRSWKRRPISEYVHELPDFNCDPHFGYKFVEWKRINEKSNDDDGYYEAIFKELWYHKNPKILGIGIGVGVLILLCICAFVCGLKFCKTDPSVDTSSLSQEITSYIIGDTILYTKLDEYYNSWVKEYNSTINSGGSFFDNFFGGNKDLDSSKWESDWKPKSDSIKKAISLRCLINKKDFAELKNQSYSTQQLTFKFAIENINETIYKEVGYKLGDVSTLTLTRIAEKMDSIKIIVYLEGDELYVETLMEYKNKTSDSITIQRINDCLNLRENLKQADLDKLINTLSVFQYSSTQQKLKDAIYRIDGLDINDKAAFRKIMYAAPFSMMNLDSIASFIENKIEKIPKMSISTINHHPIDKTQEITQYLGSDDLSEEKLIEYQNQCSGNLRKSVELCLKLWSLNGDPDNSYFWMQKQIDNNPTTYRSISNSALKKFLDKMCDTTQTPIYWKDIRGSSKDEKTLKKIESQK